MISYVIYALIRYWAFRTVRKVARMVHPWADRSFRNASPAPWYTPPAPGSLRYYMVRTIEWGLPWGIAVMCGCLAAMMLLAISINVLQLVAQFLQ